MFLQTYHLNQGGLEISICRLNQRNLWKRGVEENACCKIKISPKEDRVNQGQNKVETIEKHETFSSIP